MQSQPKQKKRLPEGVSAIHSRECATHPQNGKQEQCDCQPTYRASVYDRRTKSKIRSTTFPTVKEAVAWRDEKRVMKQKGLLAPPSRRTFREVADEWLAGAKASPPTVLNRSDEPYKPSALRGYEADLSNYVLDDLGSHKLAEIRRGDMQRLVDRLRGKGLSASKVKNIVVAVRVVFRYAVEREYCDANPTTGLRLGNGGGHRTRAATADEAAELLAALPADVRVIYATAFYAGLRRGELRGLRWTDVDLASSEITVRNSWDDYAGLIRPKSEAGADRDVPIFAVLRDHLTEHKAATGRGGNDFVFGAAADRPFTPTHIRKQALAAWKAENENRAEKKLDLLVPIGLHECRHTFVSMLSDAGVSLEEIGDYVGHGSTYMTGAYRHLLKDRPKKTTRTMDAYLDRADSRSRIEQLGGDEEDARDGPHSASLA